MVINFKKLLIFISIPLVVGFLGYLLGGGNEVYSSIIKPSFAPPSWVFPVVWTILFILMGISTYLISYSNSIYKGKAYGIYGIQLIINCLWSLWFFRFKLFLFSFFWILLLIVFVITMIYLFFKIKPLSGYLQIPYLLWLLFASILNYSVYLLQ